MNFLIFFIFINPPCSAATQWMANIFRKFGDYRTSEIHLVKLQQLVERSRISLP